MRPKNASEGEEKRPRTDVPPLGIAGPVPAPAGDPLLTAKLSIPATAPRRVRRERLLSKLTTGVNGPLTLVTGPAGADRTTLVATWARAGTVPGPVVRLSPDGDDTPGVFWPYVLAAYRHALVVPAGDIGAPTCADRVDHSLLVRPGALERKPGPLVLVLDGLDKAPGREVASGLEFLLDRAGTCLRLLVISRTDPLLPLHRFRAEDRLHEVRGADLAFTEPEAAALLSEHGLKPGTEAVAAFGRLTHVVDGVRRIAPDPPLLTPVADLMPGAGREELERSLRALIEGYGHSLTTERRHLLERFLLVDMARKVVGVGSVGTRCWIALMLGRDEDDPLLLQAKEAGESVLAPYRAAGGYDHQGQRGVVGQRLMQANSDILLGWERVTGLDGQQRDFCVRQLRDWKRTPQPETMAPDMLRVHGGVCGGSPARAHARSGDPVAIAAYLGTGGSFDRAMAEFAEAYAEQNQRDHETVTEGAQADRITARAARDAVAHHHRSPFRGEDGPAGQAETRSGVAVGRGRTRTGGSPWPPLPITTAQHALRRLPEA